MGFLKKIFEKTRRFSRDLRSELRKVIWPTRQETKQFTTVVVISVTVVALFIWLVDSVFSGLLRLII